LVGGAGAHIRIKNRKGEGHSREVTKQKKKGESILEHITKRAASFGGRTGKGKGIMTDKTYATGIRVRHQGQRKFHLGGGGGD